MTIADSAPADLTLERSRRELATQFRAAGIETPELDARALVGAVLDLDLTAMALQACRQLSRAETLKLAALTQRRLDGEPIARIVGEKEFWGLRLKLSADTLVPRPDTETVVAAAFDLARNDFAAREPLYIADIGTGSGAILLALLSELPDAIGIGTDIAPAALTVAKANAERLGYSDRVTFIASDYFAAVEGMFDLILSNPPYIRTSDIASLAREVRDHEPILALDGGADGLAAYRALCHESPGRLRAGGALVVEVGYDQAEHVARMMEAAALTVRRPFQRDLAGVQRVVVGQKTDR